MKLEANAKINLTLEVFRDRGDGYHALRSVVLPISLSDTITLEIAETLSCDTGFTDDLCLKAARALGVDKVSIHVEKRIPVGGGLGGGSADAAAVLRGLNEMCALGKTPEVLAEIGASVGSDVPALVLAQHYHRAVMMEGRGENVRLCCDDEYSLPSHHLVLANPGVHSVTAEVFRRFDEVGSDTLNPNYLEPAAVSLYPEIAMSLDRLRTLGARDVRMSGSGATVFGFASDEGDAAGIVANLKAQGDSAWYCSVLDGGNVI